MLAAVERAAEPLQRFLRVTCGAKAPNHYRQCPGYLSWDSDL